MRRLRPLRLLANIVDNLGVDNYLKLESRHTGEILRIRRGRGSDGQVFLTIDGSLPPHSAGPPLHIHYHQLEEGTVRAGSVGVQVGTERRVVPAGGSAAFPAGVVHTWWNAGEVLLELNGRAVPALDLDRFLQALFAVINASPSGRPSLFYLFHVLWRHRNNHAVVRPPIAIQRIVFPLVIALGYLLGKYRGDNWPGSPASCPGAPEA